MTEKASDAYTLKSFNLELTTKCPLRCPQCYCTLEGGKDLSFERAVQIISEAAELGSEHVELSGGETLCYPNLTELIRFSRKSGIQPNIAISGWHFDRAKAEELLEAGVGGIFISMNAPTASQNAVTRDGFEYAIHALEVLAALSYQNVYINWVMHRDTADTLPQMIKLAEPYGVRGIVIMAPKPDAAHQLNSFPTTEQMEAVKEIIQKKGRTIDLFVESCFSPLLALIGRNPFWGNHDKGIGKGCAAGLRSVSVNVDGLFSPCRHLEYFEKFESIKEYWNKSEILRIIRGLQNDHAENCRQCEFRNNCRPCIAINTKLNNALYIGNEKCRMNEKYPCKA